jgi:hypothetical protein
MSGEASRRLEGPGANQRVAEMRQKFRSSSKTAESEEKLTSQRSASKSEPVVKEERVAKRGAKGGKEPLSEREKWLAQSQKQGRKSRRSSGDGGGFRLDRGVGYFVLMLAFIGGGGAFGVMAADMGSIEIAARHLVAAPHCETAKLAGMSSAARGQPGYWAHHDPANAGVSCP